MGKLHIPGGRSSAASIHPSDPHLQSTAAAHPKTPGAQQHVWLPSPSQPLRLRVPCVWGNPVLVLVWRASGFQCSVAQAPCSSSAGARATTCSSIALVRARPRAPALPFVTAPALYWGVIVAATAMPAGWHGSLCVRLACLPL